jgi:hypothetical protein
MFFIFLVGGSNLLQLLQFQLLAISLTYLSKLGVTMLLQLCDKVLQNFPNSEKRSYYVYLKNTHTP